MPRYPTSTEQPSLLPRHTRHTRHTRAGTLVARGDASICSGHPPSSPRPQVARTSVYKSGRCGKCPYRAKTAQFRAPATHSARLLGPLFLFSLCPGPALPPERGCSFHAAAPSARDAASRAQRKALLTHRRCSRAAAPAWLDTLRGQVPSLRTCSAERRAVSCGPSRSSPQTPAKEKRALLFRGKTPSSRDTSCSLSRPRPQRREIWRRKRTWLLVSVYAALRLRQLSSAAEGAVISGAGLACPPRRAVSSAPDGS